MDLWWIIATFLLWAGTSFGREVCYEPCGCFSNRKPFGDRPLPKSPESQDLKWYLLTRAQPDQKIPISSDRIPSEYQADKPTKILVHGYRAGPGAIKGVSDAFLKGAFYDYNVIVVDWEKGADGTFYLQQASNARVAGACTGYLLKTLVSQTGAQLDDMHCIGMSLGAHVCGYVGRFLEGKIGRITGLDPAGPWFDKENPEVRLDKTDAIFNDNIHTTGQRLVSLGLGQPIGHVDFFPNKAGTQPPCEGKKGSMSCNHMISQSYFIQSIRAKDRCNFDAFPCDSIKNADKGNCETCVDGEDCQKMGYFSDQMPGRGTFFLRTLKDVPYCEG